LQTLESVLQTVLCSGDSTFLLKVVSLLWTISEGGGGSPAGAEDEGWHLHPHGGHRDIARVEHAVQVSVIKVRDLPFSDSQLTMDA
jgi:hypothetical protein